MTMNKTELIAALSEETTFSKKDVARVLDGLTRIVERSLKQGHKVSITGFGSFGISDRPARIGINPATKEKINIPRITVPKFKAGKNLRDVVKSIKVKTV